MDATKAPLQNRASTRMLSQRTTTFVDDLKQCGKRRDLQGGKRLHSNAKEAGCHTNKHVATALISMYSKCGSMHDAREAFESMLQHDVVSWTALILGYVENGESLVALDMFSSMDCVPDSFTFVAALKACASSTCLQNGVIIHEQARDRGFEKSVYVASTLVDMYRKCGDMAKARDVFDKMIHRNAVSWNALILGYVENGESSMALDVFNTMDCAPNCVTFVAALKACAGLTSDTKLEKKTCLQRGVDVHRQARERGFDRNVFVANTLVNMYSKCGDMLQAREVFDEMGQRNVVSWTALILGYVENGESLLALELFNSMDCQPNCVTFVASIKACASLAGSKKLDRKMCKAIHRQARECGFEKDVYVASALVDMYSKLGDMLQARDVFDGMIQRSAVSWTALILGYVENGECLVALEMFDRMECAPDKFTLVAVLKACTDLACLQRGVAVHMQAKELGFDKELFVAIALVDMYSKCGDMLQARNVFEGMTERNVVSWTALMNGYVENGESSVALDMFNNMDCAPDHVTFVAVLKACASLGALEVGERVHVQVCEYGLEQDTTVANCLVDFYGKCGNMAAAEEVFNRLRLKDIISWTSLIGGYRLLGDSSQVFSLLKRMQEAGLQMNSVTMLLILTACSHAGMVEEGERYFESMLKNGISPTVEHYTCMVDMLGRVNRLQEALALVNGMPFEVNSLVWITLLSGCKKWANLEIGEVAFRKLLGKKDSEHLAAAYVLMRNIYEKLGMQQEGEYIEAQRRKVVVCLRKPRQTRWYDTTVHKFTREGEVAVKLLAIYED